MLVFILCIFAVLLKAVGIFLFWSWFIVPFGLPAISLIHALGLYQMALLFRNYSSVSDDVEVQLIVTLLVSVLTITIGGGLSYFM
jgi:hypothetical protein